MARAWHGLGSMKSMEVQEVNTNISFTSFTSILSSNVHDSAKGLGDAAIKVQHLW